MPPSCPLCGTASPPWHVEAGATYHRCPACPFLFLHPAPDAAQLERLYEEEHGATFHHAAEIAAAHEKRLEARYRLALIDAVLAGAPRRSALELGCGAGYLLERLRHDGWDVTGVEKSEAYLRFARETLGLDVRRDAPPGPFGAVLLFNVLSHLPDPLAELRACRERLLPGGVLALETGNAAEVPPERVGPFGAPEHVWHFSEKALRDVLARAGFSEIVVRRRNVEPQRRLLRRLGALRGPSRPAPPATPSVAPSPAAPRPASFKRRLASRVLLWMRFTRGRLGADDRHFCTLFVTARA